MTTNNPDNKKHASYLQKLISLGINFDSYEQSKKYMQSLLAMMVSQKASDLFITVGFPPAMKINGKVTAMTSTPLSTEHTLTFAYSIMNELQINNFEETHEANFAIALGEMGRFRVNIMRQQSRVAMVIRVINTKIPEIDSLKVPPVLKKIIMEKRGLVIVVGATSSGKSTSLAAMIGYRNHNSQGHIITIEDPIEFVHEHGKCIVTQREVGIDTESWEAALKNTLRQAPDVILIGEVRDRETMEYAMAFSETGHLCLCTLHANNANQAIDRIINFFPEEKRNQLLMDLSLNLKSIVSQRLIPMTENRGRVPAVEVLIATSYIQDLIIKGDIPNIKEAMKKGRDLGMQTFDQALYDLFEAGEISYEEALRNADSMSDLKLDFKLRSARFKKLEGEGGVSIGGLKMAE